MHAQVAVPSGVTGHDMLTEESNLWLALNLLAAFCKKRQCLIEMVFKPLAQDVFYFWLKILSFLNQWSFVFQEQSDRLVIDLRMKNCTLREQNLELRETLAKLQLKVRALVLGWNSGMNSRPSSVLKQKVVLLSHI